MDKSIHEHGYWLEDIECGHWLDTDLIGYLSEHVFKNHTVVDLGCGAGQYVKFMREKGIVCDGYDGNPLVPLVSGGACQVMDLAVVQPNPKQYDWVLSLEVAEHLPPEFESNFLQNLVNHSKIGIVLSWAVIGQTGHGHFNERDNPYVKDKLSQLGFSNDVELENVLRTHCTILGYLRNTVMVFRRKL